MTPAGSLEAKGWAGLAVRAGMILARFGPTAARMERCLGAYVGLAAEYGARPTLPITAAVLGRHPALIRRLAERGVEFAIHGLVHNDHLGLEFGRQRADIARAAEVFRAAGVGCVGFRAPYLRHDAATEEAVRALGLRWHSSQAVRFRVLPEEVERGNEDAPYQRVLRFYGALDGERVAARPRERRGCVSLPVAVPDDEVMVDRLHLPPAEQTAAWLAMLEITHARGDLFTVQVHPERIFDCGKALRAVLAEARGREPAVWVARLGEIAEWWLARRDARLSVDEAEGGGYRVELSGDPRASLLVRHLPGVATAPWFGNERLAAARSFRVSGPVKPIVGISARVSQGVRDFLSEEGFLLEVSQDRVRYGAYLDAAADGADEVGLLAELHRAPGPLVRLGRWPSAARSALAVTGDIDAITLRDFALRPWEAWRDSRAGAAAVPGGRDAAHSRMKGSSIGGSTGA